LLELLSASDDGATDTLLMAHDFTLDLMVILVRAGLATAQSEPILAGRHAVEVTRRRITGAGRRALAAIHPLAGCHSWIAAPQSPGPYAARVTSFTSVSLQERQATTDKSGSPPSLWTLRTSFMMSPQAGQRRIGRLLGKTMIANPMYDPT
jgi:hypothetical protein